MLHRLHPCTWAIGTLISFALLVGCQRRDTTSSSDSGTTEPQAPVIELGEESSAAAIEGDDAFSDQTGATDSDASDAQGSAFTPGAADTGDSQDSGTDDQSPTADQAQEPSSDQPGAPDTSVSPIGGADVESPAVEASEEPSAGDTDAADSSSSPNGGAGAGAPDSQAPTSDSAAADSTALQHDVLLVSAISSEAADSEWGTLKGQFIYDGTPPEPTPLAITKDQEVCGKHKLVDESLVINPENRGLANIVVVLSLGPGQKLTRIHPDYEQTANDSVKLDNLNCRFEPRVVTVRTTQTLILGNSDPVGHNTNIITLSNPGVNPIVPAGQSIEHKFSVAERFPAEVKCSIHPWMSARVVIKDHPYMAVSDADGRFIIPNLPVGKWGFMVWQEKSGFITTVVQDGKPVEWPRGPAQLELEIKPGDNDLGTIAVAPKNFEK